MYCIVFLGIFVNHGSVKKELFSYLLTITIYICIFGKKNKFAKFNLKKRV